MVSVAKPVTDNRVPDLLSPKNWEIERPISLHYCISEEWPPGTQERHCSVRKDLHLKEAMKVFWREFTIL